MPFLKPPNVVSSTRLLSPWIECAVRSVHYVLVRSFFVLLTALTASRNRLWVPVNRVWFGLIPGFSDVCFSFGQSTPGTLYLWQALISCLSMTSSRIGSCYLSFSLWVSFHSLIQFRSKSNGQSLSFSGLWIIRSGPRPAAVVYDPSISLLGQAVPCLGQESLVSYHPFRAVGTWLSQESCLSVSILGWARLTSLFISRSDKA